MRKVLLVISFFVAFAVCANAQSVGSASDNKPTTVNSDVKVKNGEKVALIKAKIDCQNCKAKVEKNIAFVKGVKDVSADIKTKIVAISYDPKKVTEETLLKEVQKLGVGGELVKDCNHKCNSANEKDGCCGHSAGEAAKKGEKSSACSKSCSDNCGNAAKTESNSALSSPKK